MPQPKIDWRQLLTQLLAILNQLFPQPTPVMKKAQAVFAKCPCDHDHAECLDDAIKAELESLTHLLCLRECLDPPAPTP